MAVKIWFHRAFPGATNGGNLPIVDEPELATETLATSASPATSGAAPALTDVAIVEPDVDVHFRVNDGAATSADKKATANQERTISVKPGETISFIE